MLYLLILLLPTAYGQQLFSGKCSDFTTNATQNYDVERSSGRWYEISRYLNFYQVNGDCKIADISPIDDKSFSILMKYKLGGVVVVPMKPRFIDPVKKDGRFRIRMPNLPEVNYKIVDTDYENYMIEWNCIDLFNMNLQMLWVLSRHRKLDDKMERTVARVLKENNLGTRPMRKSNNDLEYCKCVYNKC